MAFVPLALRPFVLLAALALPARAAVARLPEFSAPTSPQFARVLEIASAAQDSPTAARLLAAAAAIPELQGLPVSFEKLGGNELAHFDYVDENLALDRRYRVGPAKEAAPTLVHELVHALQHQAATPAEALERELEAHALTLKVLEELGVPEAKWGSFSIAARDALRESPAAYTQWMREQLSSKVELRGRDFESVADELEEEADRLARSPKEKTRRRAEVLSADAAALRGRTGQKRYEKFSRKVKALLAREHRRLNGD